ncbi:hypothetical protein Ae201684_013495 [Aphanomyces euteiches]|uniref:Protein-serine/threonine kinase n=1 Tax=Aphanomyces euteiches TaxID=100861 RepID=A0A6G0WN24_9STRA|nr:hypothetical protein Ae201684_013495 [Aphanomyces euteiches]KAH9145155.1 hypothetical protein AeRB84_010923 [Aphanomyces euteiches]
MLFRPLERQGRRAIRGHMSNYQASLSFSSLSLENIKAVAKESPTPLTLQQMKTFASNGTELRLKSAFFLHKELQTRFSRAIVELSELPLGLNQTAPVQAAIATYTKSFEELSTMKVPITLEDDVYFTERIAIMKKRGSNLVPLICGGLHEIKGTAHGKDALRIQDVQDDLNTRLDTFFLSRMGIRMLIGQHTKEGGRVKLNNVEDIVHEAVGRARTLCSKFCGPPPPVVVKVTANGNAPFMYVKSHLHHMVFEVVKNSMRATVEHQARRRSQDPLAKCNIKPKSRMNHHSPLLGFVIPDLDGIDGVTIFPSTGVVGSALPPITVVISQGAEDLTIKISDEGGGVPRSEWRKLWQYTYTTTTDIDPAVFRGEVNFREHFSGGGYGLPIARLFARYFGGEVTFLSSEGYGSSVFIQAHRLGNKAELVPGHTNFTLQPLTF